MTTLLSTDGPLEILLVEDNPGDARLVEAHLEEALDGDVELHRASKLEEGERRLRERSPDLVRLDLDLPGSSGLATVRRLRDADPDVPVVVLTGLDDEATALQALRQGAQEYVTGDRVSRETLGRLGQGFFFADPMEAAALERWLGERRSPEGAPV